MKFKFIGGHLCLDFINTVGDHLGDRVDKFKTYEHFVGWGVAAGLLTEEESVKIGALGVSNPTEAGRLLKRGITLREILFELFISIIKGDGNAPLFLGNYNAYLHRALKHLRVESGADGFTWGWDLPEKNAELLIMIITHSASELLTGDQLKYLKVCGDDVCGWLFLDTSKNKRRAWCDMKDCGNKNKFRRFYSKRKGEKA